MSEANATGQGAEKSSKAYERVYLDNNDKKPWHKRHRTILIIAGVLLLVVILSPHGTKNKKTSQTTPQPTPAPVAANTPEESTIPPAANKLPVNEKTYFNTVWTHLDKVGKLAQPMNQSCSTNTFPPPQACTSNIQVYKQELLAAKGDLSQVVAPASFQQADATLRAALDKDLEAANQALLAIQKNNLKQWIDALILHGQAGQDLNKAGIQALDVLQ
jgi:hypothetical protein